MNGRKDTGTHHGENGHGFRRTIDRCPPLLPQEKENGGDQRSGMTNTDPPNKVNNSPAPSDGMIQPPDTDTGGNEVTDHDETDQRGRHTDQKGNPPPSRRLVLDDAADSIRDPTQRTVV